MLMRILLLFSVHNTNVTTKRLQKKEEIMAKSSKQSSSAGSKSSKSTSATKSQTKSCSNCGCSSKQD